MFYKWRTATSDHKIWNLFGLFYTVLFIRSSHLLIVLIPWVTICNMNSPENKRQRCIYKYVSNHLTGSVERIPKKHILPFRILLWCNPPSYHAPQSSFSALQEHYSTSRRTVLIHACPSPKMAFPFFMVKRSCQSVLWLRMRTPSRGHAPSGNIYWKFKNWRTLCDWSFCMHRCIAVLGNLIPVRGRHYWEVEVDETTEFRIGVAYEDTERNSYLGANNTSWCMRHILTPSRWQCTTSPKYNAGKDFIHCECNCFFFCQKCR